MGLHRVFIRENGITRDLEPFCNCLITSSQTHDGECPLFVSDAAPASASGNASRRAYRAVWRSRLLPVLTVEWQSSTAIAARINAPPHTSSNSSTICGPPLSSNGGSFPRNCDMPRGVDRQRFTTLNFGSKPREKRCSPSSLRRWQKRRGWRDLTSLRIVSLMVAAEIFAMLGSSAVAATLPALTAQWGLSPAQAGWLSGSYFLGYAVAVPILVSLTDRIDARVVFAFGCVVGIVANVGFARFAHGFVSATLLWSLAGISMAGAYMPGLRVIIDRLDPAARLRAVPYYTASFSVGVSVSFLAAGLVAQIAGWRAAFDVAGVGAPLRWCASFWQRCARRKHRNAAVQARLICAPYCATLPRCVTSSRMGTLLGAVRPARVARRALAVRLEQDDGRESRFRLDVLELDHRACGRTRQYRRRGVSTPFRAAAVDRKRRACECGDRANVGRARQPLVSACGVWALDLHGRNSRRLRRDYGRSRRGDAGGSTRSTLALHSLVGFVGGALGPIAVGIALSLVGGLASGTGWFVALAVMAAGSGVAAFAVRGVAKA